MSATLKQDLEDVIKILRNIERASKDTEQCYIKEGTLTIHNANGYPVGTIHVSGDGDTYEFMAHKDTK